MSQEKQTAEEVREDIIERTYHNINDEPDKSAIHIRIALNNYAVPFEKKLQQQAKEIADLVRSRDDVFHELEGTKEHNKQLQEEIERLKGENEFFKRMIRRKEQLSKNSDMDFGVGDLD